MIWWYENQNAMPLYTTRSLSNLLWMAILLFSCPIFAQTTTPYNYTLSNLKFTQTSIPKGERINFYYDVKNNGTTAPDYGQVGPVVAQVYFSKDNTISSDDLKADYANISTAPGTVSNLYGGVSVPISSAVGTYYIIIRTETNTNAPLLTATLIGAVTVTAPANQLLVVTNVTGTTTAKPGDVVTLNITVKNEGLAASSGTNTLQYLQEDKNYSARAVSFNKYVLPVILGNEERTFTYNFKLRDTLYPPNANFLTANGGFGGHNFGDYFAIVTNNALTNYGCFTSYGLECNGKAYNITPIYPKADVSVNMTVSKTLLVFEEKFSATYFVTNNSGSTVPNLFLSLGSFTNDGRNYSPTSYSVIYSGVIADANTQVFSTGGETIKYGWEVYNLTAGETRKITLPFNAPFKSQYGSYGAYGPNSFIQVYHPTLSTNSSFENTAPTTPAKDPLKVTLDLSKIADIELSNLTIPNPTVAENGVLNFKFDLKNIGTAPVPQNFKINSSLYKDAALTEFALSDGVITTGNIAANGQVLGVMGALTAKVPPGTYYLWVSAYDFATPLAELNKRNNTISSTIPITVTAIANATCKGDLYLNTQAQANAFNRACTNWEGLISVGGTVTDLTPLSNLKSITGGLTIVSASQLTNVQGLNNLETVGGVFVVSNCPNLTSLAALAKLNSVKTTFIISTLPKLTELGLQTVTFNDVSHAELYDVPNLQSTGNFLIKAASLSEILLTNMGVKNIDFLKGVSQIGLLQLTGNANLMNVDGLSQTTTIDKLIIATHPKLLNLDGLSQMNTVNVLTLADNTALKSCCGLVNALKNSPQASLTITGNLSGCNSKADILASCLTIGSPKITINAANKNIIAKAGL
jgi:hypothetical protein